MTELRDSLLRQFEIAWSLAQYHLETLTTDECLWRPATKGLHVQQQRDGLWIADWPDHEGYDLGPPSIAWITWHIDFWWSMVLNHSFGDRTLARQQITWPGTAEGARARIEHLKADWLTEHSKLTDEDLRETTLARWPLSDRPFGDIVAWANVELMKNAAELGYARFLYATRASA